MRAFLVTLVAFAMAGCLQTPLPAGMEQLGTDPTIAGALEVARHEFILEARIVEGGPGPSPYLVTPEGSVHLPDGEGPFPVIILMHGRHGTCRYSSPAVSFEHLGTPCPDEAPTVAPVDSYTGYDYLSESLASHGYVVASLSANHVNDRDNDYGLAGLPADLAGAPRLIGDDYGATARARILLSFLDDLRDVQAGAGPEPLRFLTGLLDLDAVGLMGHSRGGEGVARAANLNVEWPQPHALRAVFALAPIDFDRQHVPGVPFGVLLPYCDGDVSNLQGAWIYDDNRYLDGTGPLHQFLALGANHNYYNTVWTGSDWTHRGDPHCDEDDSASGRDDPEAQRQHGLAIMAAFLRAYVGGESDFLPLLNGERPFHEPGIVTSYHPLADDRWVLHDGADARAGQHAWSGFAELRTCDSTASCPIPRTYSTAAQVVLEWTAPAAWAVELDADLGGHDRISIRIGFDHSHPEAGTSPLRFTLTDSSGRNSTVAAASGVFHPPGETGAKTTLNMAAVPLAAFDVDLGRITSITISFDGSGRAQVADLMLQ